MSNELNKEKDEFVRDICAVGWRTKSKVRERLHLVLETQKQQIIKLLKKHTEYCQKQNGVSYCKNCGLSDETINKIKDL